MFDIVHCAVLTILISIFLVGGWEHVLTCCIILLVSIHSQLIIHPYADILQFADGKMRACGDAGLQFRVSRVRI